MHIFSLRSDLIPHTGSGGQSGGGSGESGSGGSGGGGPGGSGPSGGSGLWRLLTVLFAAFIAGMSLSCSSAGVICDSIAQELCFHHRALPNSAHFSAFTFSASSDASA